MSGYTGPDDVPEVVNIAPAKQRPGISLDLFDRYWSDVHGPTCARVGITWQYTQFHLGHDEGGIWSAPEGVLRQTPPEEQWDGIAELTFRSQDDLDSWLANAGVLERDEQNVFGEVVAYTTSEHRSRTYVDRIPTRVANGPIGVSRYHVLLKRQPEVSLEELRDHLTETFAPPVADHPLVLKFRLHLLDPFTQIWESENVENQLAPERIHDALIEIAFETPLDLARFQASEHYAAATAGQARFVRQISVFPERSAFSMIQEGQATLLGRRGASIAKTIVEAGAITNYNDDIMELFSGGALTTAAR
jgi:EthD domain